MNNKEIKTIENKYYEICKLVLMGYDYHKTTQQEIGNMMELLGLKKNKYIIENNAVIDHKSYNGIVREVFNMLFDNFVKYKVYTTFDIDDIEMYFENLQYNMTAEEIKCNKARIRIIKENIK